VTEGSKPEKWAKRFERLSKASPHATAKALTTLPQDVIDAFSQKTKALRRLNGVVHLAGEFRQQLIHEVEPVLRTLLQEEPPQQLESRRAVVSFLNGFLRENSLAFAHPTTGQPCTLVVSAPRGAENGMISLRVRNFNRQPSALSMPAVDRPGRQSKEYLPLQLIFAPREEAFAGRARREGD
jgi:hypothetical protein